MEQDAPLELETDDEIRQRLRGGGAAAEGEDGPPAPRRRLPVVLAIIVLVLAAVEAGATLVQHLQAPQAADWKAAAQTLSTVHKSGEPVLFAPAWVDPVGRLHMGDQIETELLLLSDVDRYRRVFLVSTRGAAHPWLAGEKPTRRWELGAVTLAVFERAKPAKVLFDFTRRIREARVSRIGPQVTRCPWNDQRGRFACDPARGWNWVGPHLAEVGHRPYRCIFAHPVDGQVMRLTFPAVEMGRTLVGNTGIDDFENRKRANEPVLLRVLVGPQEIRTIRHENTWPWRRFSIDTKEMAGQTHPVSFEVTARSAFARAFCFSAETRD